MSIAADQPAHTLGSVQRIDDRTVLVLGQDLDIAHDQPDVANALLHRVGDTLFLVDTGATAAFRTALREAIDLVGPWSRLVVLTTHGHLDHVGNHDLADELADQRSIRAQVYVPAADLPQMRDPHTYWTTAFHRLPGLAPLPAAPTLAALKVTSLFRPFRPFSRHTQTYERTSPETISIGSRRLVGWSYAGGAVTVIRSQGHCAGHVVVYLRDAQLLHMGDELNGPCPVMHDADQHKLTEIQTVAADLIRDGMVRRITDGHSPLVHDADSATIRLHQLLDQGLALQGAAADLTDDELTVPPARFSAGMVRAYQGLAVQGANANPVFLGMMAAAQLRRLGYTQHRTDTRWHSTPLEATTPARTAARAVVGLLATLPWILRGLRHPR